MLTVDEELNFEITIVNLTLEDNERVQFNLHSKSGGIYLLHSTYLIVTGLFLHVFERSVWLSIHLFSEHFKGILTHRCTFGLLVSRLLF